MMNKNLEEKVVFHIMFIFMAVIAVTGNQCCLQFSGSTCLSCPTGMHLYRSNCIFDLEGCDKYSNGFDCSDCRQFYSLNNGTCKHARFPPSLTNLTDFQVYLQSNLKPDQILDIALKKITILDTWIDWLSHSLLLNKTYLNRNTLIKNAQKIMNSIISPKKLHYIFTGNQSRNDTQMLYYRLTYELNLIGGFADCVVAVQMVDGRINYMELNEVKQRSLDRDGVWLEMKHGGENQTYALSKVEEIFGKKDSSEFLKGYIKQNSEDLNITMFFMDKIEGVIAYIYIADKSQLPSPKAEQPTIDKTPTQIPAQTLQISKETIIHAQIKPNNSTIIQKDSKTTPAAEQKQISAGVTIKNNTFEIEIKMSEFDTNPIFQTGYALYLNLYATTKSPIVQSIFYYNKTKIVYGMKIKNEENKEEFRFCFGIDEVMGEIEIISYQKLKKQNGITTQPSFNLNSNNSTHPPNISPNPFNISQQIINSSSTSPISQTLPINNSVPVSCNQQKGSQLIDITNKQSSDIFLPQINLVLKSLYDTLLTNSILSSVKYSLGTQQNLVSNISYYITYKTNESNYLDFQVAIINNQFQLVRYPNITSSTSSSSFSPSNNSINPNNSTNNSEILNTTSIMDLNNATISSAVTVTPSIQNISTNINDTTHQEQKIINTANTEILTNLQASQNKKEGNATSINTEIISSTKELNTTEIQQKINKTIPETAKKDESITDKKNESSKIQINISSSSLPENKTQQSQPDTTPESSMIAIPQKNYTTQPRYKSLITILRSLYRIPSNATILSMKTWQSELSGDRNYQIIFKMIYQKPINDDTIAKISSYNVSVNTNSFVSVLQQTIQYEKKPILPVPKGPSLSRSYSPNFPKPPLSFIGALSTNLKKIYDFFTLHSPILKDYNLESLRHDQGPKNFGGMVSISVQKIKFTNIDNKPICFDVTYETTNPQKQPNDSHFISIITYFLVNCPTVSTLQQSIPNFNVSTMNFNDEVSMDPKILSIIQRISNVLQIEVVTKETYSNFMRIRYRSTAFGIRQMLIDTNSMFILTYQSSTQLLYSENNSKQSLMRVEIIEKIRCQIEVILNLPPKTINITIIQKHGENLQLVMFDIVCKNTIRTFWYSKIYEMIKVQAVYYLQKSFIKIISINSEGLFYGKHSVKSSAIQNQGELSIKQTLEEPLFGMLMASIKREYSSFIQNTTLLSAFIEVSNTNNLHDYLGNDQGANVMLAISKRYTATYYTAYLLKVKFYAAKNVTTISNLQALSLSSLAIDGCFVLQNEKTNLIPVCASCKDGYRIFQGFCQPMIHGCIDYSMSKCVKCNTTMLISQDMQSCLALDSPIEQALTLRSISYYQ